MNQSLAILDALAPRAIDATLTQPPAHPQEGACYLVASGAAGDWSGKRGQPALAIGGSWHFIAPAAGMLPFDREGGQWLFFRNSWQHAEAPTAPSGGNVIDNETRAAVVQLIETLQTLGLIP